MKWDVFISHAGEDKDFVRQLAEALTAWGLSVWFDEFTLHAGDSLRRAIDDGLAQSRFGIVVLSSHFFAKEWPKRELDGLIARENGSQKVIIPVWHKVSAEDVKRFSLTLADRLSIDSNGPIEGVVEKIIRTIYHEINQTDGWTPILQGMPDGTELVILPIRPEYELAIGIGRHPITNAQYRRFLEETGHSSPVGDEFKDGQWKGPFQPLDSPIFNLPQQPIVCVNCEDAHLYCEWLTAKLNQDTKREHQRREEVFIPHSQLWDFAATGIHHKIDGGQVLGTVPDGKYHHRAQAPTLVSDERVNALGVSDMFGNVWEWCMGEYFDTTGIGLVGYNRRQTEVELRGGGFLDDLSKIHPVLRAGILDDGAKTRHTDLGFRVAAIVELGRIPANNRAQLAIQSRFSTDFWVACYRPRGLRYSFGHGYAEFLGR